MSSDSDLEYESADEDTIDLNKSEKENKFNDKLVTELAAEKNETNNTVLNIDSTSTDVSEKCIVKKCESELTESETNLNKSEESKINVSKTDFEIASGLMELNDVVVTRPEKQRVPLRREMKKQQKSLLCKKISPEKEHLPKACLEEKQDFPAEKLSSCEASEGKAAIEQESISQAERNDSNASFIDEGKSSSWGFSGWGSSLLSTAASSVSSFSNQVSQGLGSVLETVENTLGAPSPEELASALKEKKNESSAENESEEEVNSGILPGVSAWTKVFENTGSKVLMGGLDTLELIGKKTMDILTEGDPGLRSKRTLFSDKANLSQILREAKEQADKENENNSSSNSDVIHYSQIFDDQQGLVHLEALEMLSKQTQAKFQRLLMRHSKKEEVKKRIEEINRICENVPGLDDPSECEEFEDFESVFKKHVFELNLPLNVDNIVKTQRKLSDNLSKFENVSEEPYVAPDEIYRSSICSLAEFTARSIETFHKVAELILVQKNVSSNLEHCATNLTGLTTVICIEINNLSSKYHKCLDSSGNHFSNYTNAQGLNITAMATNLYMEASNSNKYIQDAFLMIVPVLQVCLLESLDE